MIKIANIVGARPQFIKYYPLSKALEQYNLASINPIQDILIHTGQHYDYMMSKIFFDELGLKEPNYHLGVGSASQGKQTGLILSQVEDVLQSEEPDFVIVYGDTNSTIGGALAAVKLHIPVIHIEAGLRSLNKRMPEEINRLITDHISTLLLCPSKSAVDNLRREGFQNIVNNGELILLNNNLQELNYNLSSSKDHATVVNIGDIMYDVLLSTINISENPEAILKDYNLAPNGYYVLTLHRAGNSDDPEQLGKVIDFINKVSHEHEVIFPIHPRTKKNYLKSKKKFSKMIKIVEPVSYVTMIHLLKNSALLLTDSGGLQKEAYWLKLPCITLRDETEWPETIDSGWNVFFKEYAGSHFPKSQDNQAYGDGRAATRILMLIENLAKC
jgi:UDP-GlcNAc3NAcA epimerase